MKAFHLALTGMTAAATLSLGVAGCGSSKKAADPAPAPTPAATWADVQPIIAKSCATAKCHAAGGLGTGNYTGISEANFRATKSKDYLNGVPEAMPQVGSPEAAAFTADDKAKLLSFLNAK